jgi:hypothetical protein
MLEGFMLPPDLAGDGAAPACWVTPVSCVTVPAPVAPGSFSLPRRRGRARCGVVTGNRFGAGRV